MRVGGLGLSVRFSEVLGLSAAVQVSWLRVEGLGLSVRFSAGVGSWFECYWRGSWLRIEGRSSIFWDSQAPG